MDVYQLIIHFSRFLKKNSSNILTASSIIGVGATAYVANQEGYKRCLKDQQFNLRESNKIKRFFEDNWRTLISSGLTIGGIIGGKAIDSKNIKSLQAICLASEAYNSSLETAAASVVGTETLQKIKEKSVEQKNKHDEDSVLFYDDFNDRLFISDTQTVMDACYMTNRELTRKGSVKVSFLCDQIGIDYPTNANYLYWDAEDMYNNCHDCWIDFDFPTVKLKKDGFEEYTIITANPKPQLHFF